MKQQFRTFSSALLLATAAFTAPGIASAGASSPAEVALKLETFFATDDVTSMMSLYNDESVMASQPGGDIVKGPTLIRPILQGFADAAETIDLDVRTVYQTGNIALLIVDYTMVVKNQEGQLVEMKGTATDVVKKAADGEWYYLIDNPYGVTLPQ